MDLGTTALDPRSGSRRLLDYTYIWYHIGITTDHFGHTPIGACVWFDSTDRRYGGQSDEVPPVPVPNTVVKLVCVTLRTGVGDPLGEAFRRRPLIFNPHRATALCGGFCHYRERVVPLRLNELGQYHRPCQGGRVRPNAAACRAAHRRFKSGPWLRSYSVSFLFEYSLSSSSQSDFTGLSPVGERPNPGASRT